MSKGDSLDCGNYCGLKLLEVLQKVLERILETQIRKEISIDSMQFGFMPGRGTTDALFILWQMQEKYLGKKKDIFFAFVDLEKAFDHIPRRNIQCQCRCSSRFCVKSTIVYHGNGSPL